MKKFVPTEGLKQLQKVDTETLKILVDIFERENLNYYIIAGSLLGAVRHKGFIPWDDDLDIGLPRPDYEKFLEFRKEWLPLNYLAENYSTMDEYKYYITRVYNKNVEVREIRGNSTETTYASIDLFPMDGTPNNKFLRKAFVFKIMFYRMLASLANYKNIDKRRKRSFLEKALIIFFRFLHPETWLNQKKIYKHIDSLLKKQNYTDSEYIGSLMGAYRQKEVFPKSYIGSRVKYKFSNFWVFGPENSHSYLRHMYGNYMEIPDSDQIKEKQHFEIIEKESSR